MLPKSNFIAFILLLCIQSSIAQVDNELVIDNIKYEGAEKSNITFLSEHIKSSIGSTPSDSLIQEDIQRLKNLSSIGNANYRIENNGEQLELIFELNEVRTLLPILTSGRIKDNLWFQAGFVDINWRGRGQIFSAAYLNNDGRHSGNIYFKNPKILNSNWGFSASLSSWSSLEPLFFNEGAVNYEYGNDAIGLTGIYNLDRKRNIELGTTFFIETYERSTDQISDITVGPDRLSQPKLLTKAGYSETFLDYDLFYLKGLAWNALYQNVFNTIDNSWFHILQVQGAAYLKVGRRGNFANRIRLGISTNDDSPFAPFVADSHVNIRGIGNRIDRGTAQIFLNTEYRQAFIESNRIGVQGVLFSDIGTWRNPGGRIKDLFDPNEVRVFAGVGIRIIYPKIYGAVLRIDYSVELSDTDRRGFVIGLGQYF